MTSSTSLFTVRGIHYCYCCWDLGQLPNKKKKNNNPQSKTTNWGWGGGVDIVDMEY